MQLESQLHSTNGSSSYRPSTPSLHTYRYRLVSQGGPVIQGEHEELQQGRAAEHLQCGGLALAVPDPVLGELEHPCV